MTSNGLSANEVVRIHWSGSGPKAEGGWTKEPCESKNARTRTCWQKFDGIGRVRRLSRNHSLSDRGDPFIRHLVDASAEEESLGETARHLLDKAYDDIDAGRLYGRDELRREFDLWSEQDRLRAMQPMT